MQSKQPRLHQAKKKKVLRNGIICVEAQDECLEEILRFLDRAWVGRMPRCPDLDDLALGIHADLKLKVLDDGGINPWPLVFQGCESVGGHADLSRLGSDSGGDVLGRCEDGAPLEVDLVEFHGRGVCGDWGVEVYDGGL